MEGTDSLAVQDGLDWELLHGDTEGIGRRQRPNMTNMNNRTFVRAPEEDFGARTRRDSTSHVSRQET